MRRSFILLLIAVMILAGCAPSAKEVKSSAGTFTNPVYAGLADHLPEAPDPYALKYNGEYYAYVTGDPCLVLKSDDLVHWKLLGPMLAENVNCWAPSVTYKNGIFYAYASTVKHDEGEGMRRVRLYTSQSPAGPFALQATVTDRYSYDGEYFRDEDGQEYLYWTEECYRLGQDCSGNGVAVDRLVSMDKLSGQLTYVAGPSGWECVNRCILEAPSVIKRDGTYYLQYSGSAYENENYGGGYLRSATPMGPGGANDHSWTKISQVLKSVEVKVSGPGGASWVKAPNNLEDWAIYHGRGYTKDTLDRWLRIDQVMWGKDQFWLPGAPTYDQTPAPGLPAFRDLFSSGTALSGDWQSSGGKWSVADGQAHQADPAGGGARALVKQAAATDYVAEVNVRMAPGASGAPAGQAGMYAYYADDKHYVTALLDPIAKIVQVEAVNGENHTTAKFTPAELNAGSYHQLLVRKNGSRFAFRLDGVVLGTVAMAYDKPGRIGLATNGAAADFDGVAVTHGWEDFFDDANVDWGNAEDGTVKTGDWQVQQGGLLQNALAGEQQAFRGSRQWASYAFTASLKLAEAGQDAAYGIYATYYDQKNHAEVLIDPKAGTLTLNATVKGGAQPGAPVALKDFDPAAFHAIRVIKNGFAFTVDLDGKAVAQRSISLAQGQPGLLTRNAQVLYDSITAVRD